MRILFINDHATLGGKEKYLAATRRALREGGHVTGSIHTVRSDLHAIEGDEISFRIPGIDTYRDTRATLARLRECTDLFKPDVIHMNHNAVNLIAVAWLLRRFPVLRSVHDVAFLCPIRYYIRENTHAQCDARCGPICFSSGCLSVTRPRAWYSIARTKIAQWIYARWSKLNTQSRYLQANLLNITGNPGNVSALPVFVSSISSCDPPSPSNFLYVGRLNRRKGPQLAIEAMLQLPERAILDIVGAGDMEGELHDLVQKLNLPSRVRFWGFLEGEDLQRRYASSCAVLLPGMIPENCPMSVQEAMAACRAVIATNVGGIPDLVKDGFNGYLVPPNDVASLAAAMQRLLENPDLCRTFGLNGQSRIADEQYQRDYHIRKLMEEYAVTIEAFRKGKTPPAFGHPPSKGGT